MIGIKKLLVSNLLGSQIMNRLQLVRLITWTVYNGSYTSTFPICSEEIRNSTLIAQYIYLSMLCTLLF